MRSHILRDVVAGCAGVLAVVALIGLPGNSSRSGSVPAGPNRCVKLLPVYKGRPGAGWQTCPPQPPTGPVAPRPVSP
jgi:hypothetical protein